MSRPYFCGRLVIVSIDVVGYSRLMEEDEQGTHRALMTCRRDILEPIVLRHDGHIIKSTGDGALITFATADDAVEGMIAFQERINRREAKFPESRRLVFRIGIHVSEAMFEEGDLYGHGVNVAVRLQEAAGPGSIYLSGAVVEELRDQSDLDTAFLGQRTFKNLMIPVSIFCLERKKNGAWKGGWTSGLLRKRDVAAALIGISVLIFPSGAMRGGHDAMSNGQVAEHEAEAAGDLADASSRADRVEKGRMARTTADNPLMRQSYDGLGRYSLVGHILRQNDRTRLHVEPSTLLVGQRPWTRALDLSVAEPGTALRDSAGMQDAMPETQLGLNQRNILSRHEIADDNCIEAWSHYVQHSPSGLRDARKLLDEALRLAPGHDEANALLAAVYWSSWRHRWPLGTGDSVARTLKLAQHHLNQVSESIALAHVVTSEMLTASGLHAEAILEAERAMLLEPSMAVGYYAKGLALLYDGRPDKAEGLIEAARRLDPRAPRYLFGLALAQYGQDRYGDAFETLNNATARNAGDDWSFLLLAATSGHLGRVEEARLALGQFDKLSLPRRGWFATQIPYVHSWPFRQDLDRQRLHHGMIMAGVPRRLHIASHQWYDHIRRLSH